TAHKGSASAKTFVYKDVFNAVAVEVAPGEDRQFAFFALRTALSVSEVHAEGAGVGFFRDKNGVGEDRRQPWVIDAGSRGVAKVLAKIGGHVIEGDACETGLNKGNFRGLGQGEISGCLVVVREPRIADHVVSGVGKPSIIRGLAPVSQ